MEDERSQDMSGSILYSLHGNENTDGEKGQASEATAKAEAKAKQDYEASKGQSPQLTMMVIGNTGAGKSTLINSMLGKKKAKISHDIDPTDHNTIEEHTGTVCGTPVVFYDTRGLGDPKLKNKELMNSFKQLMKLPQCSDRFTILICQRFSDKFGDSIVQFAELLAKYFKDDYSIWKNCILVLTRANQYDPDDDESDEEEEEDRRSGISPEELLKLKMDILMKRWATKFQSYLEKYNVPEEIIMNMPVFVAGNKKKLKLPVTDNWIKTIMNHCDSRALHFQSATQMQRQLRETGVFLGGTVGGVVAGVALPIIGIPIGITIGSLIGFKMGERYYHKAVCNKVERKYKEDKVEELKKKK
ncbi:PREDICTED: translocase of chloroplast 34, chloroplastic-like [Amphimedon queenslandica]|uniref:G domain-containing protein n=1 Tax=Amphimedon queenslandica TaxID=400682 RepID=A0A1X7TKZ7_AMPQE|nr:PREDICTED: translocase of chloroplast 34, chloroplastic-like [Amphimedon queenslandica]|eukprot:XP_019858991.1 PREDICTED: translocase of chloroplast 34, chloroplastic-like [Amphimedon queenslandica]